MGEVIYTSVKRPALSLISPALPGNELIRLLVVDDSEADRRLIDEYLGDVQDFKYEIFGVGSLRDAENALSLYQFDVVVLDYQLGDGCGLDFVRQTHHLRRAPVVLLNKRPHISAVGAEPLKTCRRRAVVRSMDHQSGKQ